MASALKCDKCGKFYEQPMVNSNVRVIRYVHYFGDKQYDFCPKCQSELESWLGLR